MSGASNPQGDSIILEEEIDPNYVPSEDEVMEYAKWLGMDLEKDVDMFWIAREGLKVQKWHSISLSIKARSQAPLPDNWKPCKTTDTDEIYYFNFATGESTWDHPCDEYYRNLYEEQRKKRVSGEKEMSDAKKKQAKDDVRKLLGKEDARDVKKKKGKRSAPELGPLSGDAGGVKSIFDRKPLPSITAGGSSDFSASSSPRTTQLSNSPKSVGADKTKFRPSVAESSLEKDGPSPASKRLSSALGPSDSNLYALPAAARIKSNDALPASAESEAKTAKQSDEQQQEKRELELRRTEHERNQLQSRVSQLTAAVENAEAIAKDARTQLEAETRSNKLRVASLERDLDRAQRRRDELQAEADDGGRRLAETDSEARRLRDSLRRLEDDLGNAKERADAAELEGKRWRERANATEAQHLDQTANAQRAQRIAEDRVDELQSELERRRGENEVELARATDRIETLERELAIANKRATHAKTELTASAALSSKLEVAESKAREAEYEKTHRIGELQFKLDEAERRLRVAQSAKGDELSKMLQSQLDEANRRLAEVENSKRDEMSRLKLLLEGAELRLNETEKAKREEESRLNSQLEEAKRRLIEVQNSVSVIQDDAQLKARLEESERRLSEAEKGERENVSRLNLQLEDAERRLCEIAKEMGEVTTHKLEAERTTAEAQARAVRAESLLADEKRKREELEKSREPREPQVSLVDTSADDLQQRLAEAESQSDEARERAIKAQAALTAMEKMYARTGAELLAVRRKVDLLSAENEELQEWQRRHGMPIESPTTCASNQTLDAGSVSSRESSELARCNIELTELNERARLLEQTLTSVEQRAVDAEERERVAVVKERAASNALSSEREKLSASERALQIVKAELADARKTGAQCAESSALIQSAEARRDAAIRELEGVRTELTTARAEEASTSARQYLECAAFSAATEESERRRDDAEAKLATAEARLFHEREEMARLVRESAATTKQLEARLANAEARASQLEERGQRAEARVSIAESKLVALAAEKRAADAAKRAAEKALETEKESRHHKDTYDDAEQQRRADDERLAAAEAAVASAEAEQRRLQAEASAARTKAESAEHRAALADGHQTSAREAAVAAEERCADVELELRSARAAIVDLEKKVAEAVAAQKHAEAAGERAERAAAAKIRAVEDERDVACKRLDDELRTARNEARYANDKLHDAGDSAVLSIRAETAERERNAAQARAVRAEASIREVSANYETARERAERTEQERNRALERAEVAEAEGARAKEDLHVAQRANADLLRQLDQLRIDLTRRTRSRTEDQPARSRASSLASRPTFQDTLDDGPTPQPDDTMSSASSAVRRKPARSAWRDRVEVEHHAIVKATALVKRQRDWLRRKQRKLEQKRDEWRRRSSREQPASDAARRRLDDETDDLNRLVRQLRGIQVWLGERESKIKRFELALQRSQRYAKSRRPEEDNEIDDDECASSELEDLGAELDDDARSLSSLFDAITPRRHEPRGYDQSSRQAAWPPPGSYIVVQPNQPPPFMFPSAYAPPTHPMAYASTIHQPPHLHTRPVDETRRRMDEWERLHLDTVRTSLVNAKLNGEASKSRTAAAHALQEQLQEWTQNRTRASEAVQHHLKWLEHLRSELTAHAYGNTVATTTVPKLASDHPPYIPPPKFGP